MSMSSNFYLQKPVLVTGGAGFIGSHLVEYLLKQGAYVSVLDNLSAGSMENISPVIRDIVFIDGDVTSFQTCLAVTQNQSIIFHLAGLTSVAESVLQPRIYFNNNVKGTYNMLEAARINRVERFLFSSSAAVYGDQQQPCCETMACQPTSPYGLSKLMCEQLCRQYYELFKVYTVCLRYFNVYGPRQHANRLGAYMQFKAAMQRNEPITIFGDGLQTRDFVAVYEVAQANALLAQLPLTHLNSQVINIASGTTRSLNDVLAQLKSEFPTYADAITYQPARSGDIKNSAANIDKYKKFKEFFA